MKRAIIDIPKCLSLLRVGKTQCEVARIIGVNIGTLNAALSKAGFLLGKNQKRGRLGEIRVAALLVRHGRKIKRMPYRCSFDFLVDGHIKVELKTAKRSRRRGFCAWQFNLHRHGNLSEACDYYILRLENIPECKSTAIHLLLKAPQARKTISISIRGLMNGMGQYARDFQQFSRGKKVR